MTTKLEELELIESCSCDVSDDMVFCSDLLDALTQDFFSRKGNSIEEPLHVEDIKVRAAIAVLGHQHSDPCRSRPSLTGPATRGPRPVCGNRERTTAPPSYSRRGGTTTSKE